MSRCLFVLPPINHLVILSLIALVGGLYFLFYGFHLLACKRALLNTPTSRIRSAALGLVEVNGQAVGPNTMPAPITGKQCFLYRTVVWQQRDGKKQEWEQVADETLHLPFFIDDSTGKLLIEPLGADLDLHCDFREEFDASFFSSIFFSNGAEIPPRITVFLARHGIMPGRRIRIEEHAIKPGDALFVSGTLAENPGVQLRPFARQSDVGTNIEANSGSPANGGISSSRRDHAGSSFPAPASSPQIIKLPSSDVPSSTQEMSQQAKIAAALTRAGITRPEAWSVAGVPYQSVAVESDGELVTLRAEDAASRGQVSARDHSNLVDVNSNPPVVLMKGANDPTFMISFRSQKEFIGALGWKSVAMVWGGAAIALLGIYVLMTQMKLL